MDRLRVRIYRCSLALSVAVSVGLAGWVGLVLLGGPTGSIALAPSGRQTFQSESSVELAQARSRRERAKAERSQRERQREDESHPEPPKDAEPAPESDAKAPPAAKDDAAKTAAPDQQPSEPAAEPVEQVWSDAEIIAALEECVQVLAPIAAHVEVSKPIRSGQCGAPAAVLVKRVGRETPVQINPPAVVNCRMVARLHEWVDATLQPAARELLDAPVTRMVNASGYVCRNRNGASQGKLSEHAFANAIDISAFVTADRRTIDVLTHWGKTERDLRAIALAKAEAERQAKAEAAAAKAKAADKEQGEKSKAAAKEEETTPRVVDKKAKDTSKNKERDDEPPEPRAKRSKDKDSKGRELTGRSSLGGGNPRPVEEALAQDEAEPVTPEGTFLRRLHKGACGPFTTVLGPEANEAHRNHFHFDLAERRSRRPFCE